MKDFRLFDISDFVMDEDFIRWVYEKRKEDNDFWNNWLTRHPHKNMVVAEARRILESIEMEQRTISETEVDSQVQGLLQTIREQEQSDYPIAQIYPIRSSRKWWYAAASVLIIALAVTIFYSLISRGTKTGEFAYTNQVSSRHLIENVNTSDKAITVKLPDGSTVKLSANSRISYANNLDSSATRDVYLSGEAFFNVTKNPSRPFRVYANEIVSKVVGTSFSVRSFEQDTVIQVTVRTGKVSVYSQTREKKGTSMNKHGEIMVMPNQQLLYQKEDESFQKVLLKDPIMTEPMAEAGDRGYEDVPITTVFKNLSEAYEINIVFDAELLKHCTINAPGIKNESFYQKLDLICKAIGARYEIIDGQIIIQSNGCQSN
jgi:transmembrane sensor